MKTRYFYLKANWKDIRALVELGALEMDEGDRMNALLRKSYSKYKDMSVSDRVDLARYLAALPATGTTM